MYYMQLCFSICHELSSNQCQHLSQNMYNKENYIKTSMEKILEFQQDLQLKPFRKQSWNPILSERINQKNILYLKEGN